MANTQIRNSIDPNDIIGPSGAGTERWLTAQQTLPYKIRFENLATATAPAVWVTVTHTLDADLDLNSFSLGDFGFRNIDIDVPDGLQAYSTRVDLRSTLGYYVDFHAALDSAKREVTWLIDTIDPITGERPMVLDAGFLPPNNANHDGEGYVNYAINAKAGLPTGTQIGALATIQFDDNVEGRLSTPLWRNTVDVSGPSSSVAALPAQSSPSFAVSWSGSDAGSGIASYDIYASTDGGPFTLWLDNTTATTATFNGQVGKRYGFYSVATDRVGYVEARPAVADATTSAIATQPVISLAVSPASVSEDGTSKLVYTFTRQGDSSRPLQVKFAISGSAILGADYTGLSATSGQRSITFAAGAANATIHISPTFDRLKETNETVTLQLTPGTGYTVATRAAVTGTIFNDDLIGTPDNNALRGTTRSEFLDGRQGKDTLDGGVGPDVFGFSFGHSTIQAPDRITDFRFGTDKIDLFTSTGGNLPAPKGFTRASNNNTATTLAALATAVFSDADGSQKGKQALGANRAALVVATKAPIAGTYIFINNSSASLDNKNDLLINITGASGALPGLGMSPAGSLFA